jgi:tetrahydromethanopterin S-methyltransferase subunit F
MQSLYRVLLISFIISVISGIFVAYYYIELMQTMLSLIKQEELNSAGDPNLQMPPDEFMNLIFSGKFIISLAVCSLASLVNTIVGIILIARNKSIESGMKVLWILGFVLIGFITNIVFFALKNKNNLLGENNTA